MIDPNSKTVADFFAGIGLVTLGFERAGWKTVYALDFDYEKLAQYSINFDSGHYKVIDIAKENGRDLPNVTLAHASFPCTDLSVAGARKGIHEGQSSSFWHFVRILSEMKKKHGSANPRLVLLENVEGLMTSNSGKDLRSVIEALNRLGYRTDLLRINAAHFVPQSRVRIFIVGIHKSAVKGFDRNNLLQEHNLRSSNARPKKIVDFVNSNSDLNWYFHPLPNLPERKIYLEDVLDSDAEWWPRERSSFLYNQLHWHHKKLINEAKTKSSYNYFPAFRRMRMRDGKTQSTVELRNDGIAGCLRTPKGGSARQIIVRAGRGKFDARLINGKEAARLMGADQYKIDPALSLNQVLFGFGDAVCVPAVEWLARNYFDAVLEMSPALDKLPILRLQKQLA